LQRFPDLHRDTHRRHENDGCDTRLAGINAGGTENRLDIELFE
jgi:hypothetical protein